jgi:hypothetical protein
LVNGTDAGAGANVQRGAGEEVKEFLLHGCLGGGLFRLGLLECSRLIGWIGQVIRVLRCS